MQSQGPVTVYPTYTLSCITWLTRLFSTNSWFIINLAGTNGLASRLVVVMIWYNLGFGALPEIYRCVYDIYTGTYRCESVCLMVGYTTAALGAGRVSFSDRITCRAAYCGLSDRGSISGWGKQCFGSLVDEFRNHWQVSLLSWLLHLSSLSCDNVHWDMVTVLNCQDSDLNIPPLKRAVLDFCCGIFVQQLLAGRGLYR